MDDTGVVYTADSGSHLIRHHGPGGHVTTLAGRPFASGSTDGQGTNALFWNPYSIVVDRTGHLYVSDSFNSTIRKITAGVVTTFAGAAGFAGTEDGPGPDARFNARHCVAIDTNGNVFVADYNNGTIRRSPRREWSRRW